jgi:hypothetical protein
MCRRGNHDAPLLRGLHLDLLGNHEGVANTVRLTEKIEAEARPSQGDVRTEFQSVNGTWQTGRRPRHLWPKFPSPRQWPRNSWCLTSEPSANPQSDDGKLDDPPSRQPDLGPFVIR